MLEGSIVDYIELMENNMDKHVVGNRRQRIFKGACPLCVLMERGEDEIEMECLISVNLL